MFPNGEIAVCAHNCVSWWLVGLMLARVRQEMAPGITVALAATISSADVAFRTSLSANYILLPKGQTFQYNP